MLKKNRITQFLRTKPVYLLLLPVFFVLHGFSSYYDSVPVKDALMLCLVYMLSAILIAVISWLFFRDWIKASLLAFLLTVFQFFFGTGQDFLKLQLPGTIFSQYRFILPASFILLLVLAIGLKKRSKPLFTVTSYLNILLLVFILVDTGGLLTKTAGSKNTNNFFSKSENLTNCDTCSKPDIFFILTDQYAGNSALKAVFNFDNSAFENELRDRGFYVAENSSSNYNLTPFSMASILNMEYLALKDRKIKFKNITDCYKLIKNNRVVDFLRSSGYQIYNNSIFDLKDEPAHEYAMFLHYGEKLISSQTFTSRMKRDFRSAVSEGRFGMKSMQNKIAYEYLHFNDDMMNRTVNIASEKNSVPKFVYTHLMMPHYPYYFDSKGKPVAPEKLSNAKKATRGDYIEYLQYCNTRLLKLADDILKKNSRPAIIIILGDHGFQDATDHRYDFSNLNAVYFPGKNYKGLYANITNVNMFRIIFNHFHARELPLQKDSTIVVWE